MSALFRIITLSVSLILLLGIIAFFLQLKDADFDFTKLVTQNLVTNTYEIDEPFELIEIDVSTTDVIFALSDDGKCRVEFIEDERLTPYVNVSDHVLKVGITDTRKWYEHIGFFFGDTKITVYCPSDSYYSLRIDSDTGDVYLPKGIQLNEIKIHSDTSDVTCLSTASKYTDIVVDTGDVVLDGVDHSEIIIKTTTGEIELNDVLCMTVDVESDTGNILFNKVNAIETIDAESDTGDVVFKSSDAGEIEVKTSTGDVRGTLLTDKIFFTETSTGSVKVPKTISGGTCDIKTSTGDINIKIAD